MPFNLTYRGKRKRSYNGTGRKRPNRAPDLEPLNLRRTLRAESMPDIKVSLDQKPKKRSREFNKKSYRCRRIPYTPRTRYEKSLQPLVEWTRFSQGGTMQIVDGQQHVQDMAYVMCRKDDLQLIYNKLYNDVVNGVTSTNVYRASTGEAGAINTSGSTTIINDLPPLLCHGWIRTYTFMNTGTSTVYLDIWEMMARETGENIPDYPASLWDLDLKQNYNYGMGTLPTNTAAPTMDKDYTKYKSDPWARPDKDCKNLWEAYKCTGKHVTTIPPGKVVTISVRIHGFALSQKTLFHYTDANTPENNATYWKIGNLTNIHLAMMNTPLAYDASTGTQTIGRGDGFLSFRWRETMKFSMPIKARTMHAFTTNIDYELPADYGSEYPTLDQPANVFAGAMAPQEVLNVNEE